MPEPTGRIAGGTCAYESTREPDVAALSGRVVAVETITAEVYEAGLTPFEARALTDEIRQTLRTGHDLLIRAFTGQAWSALGYETWDAYCAGEFADARMVRLDREQRREIVAEMREAGMSTRAIASGLGVPKSTVIADAAATDQNGSVATPIIGTNGKTYQPPAPRPVAAPVTPEEPTPAPRPAPRRPLPESFDDAVHEAARAIERLTRLVQDDRFTRNAEQVATRNRGDLLRAHEALSGVLAQLP